ncbi:MAG: hypothetical protein E3J69_05110 [Anaerolineales bacterium]|nr:MAG: hypothetical protein E3J69_05110 [Anaerolineales bacterium]
MRVIDRIKGLILAFYARIIQRTAPLTIEGWEHVSKAFAADNPILFTVWHGQQHLLFALAETYLDTSKFVLIVVGDHRQQVLESFAASIGVSTIPISMDDNSFAGARSLIELINELRKGRYSLIAPDGPDGPPRIPKRGTAFIANRAQALVIPLAAYSPFAYRLRRWDRYSLPLPFARIYCSVRPPFLVSRDADLDLLLEQITGEINIANERAEAMSKRRK